MYLYCLYIQNFDKNRFKFYFVYYHFAFNFKQLSRLLGIVIFFERYPLQRLFSKVFKLKLESLYFYFSFKRTLSSLFEYN